MVDEQNPVDETNDVNEQDASGLSGMGIVFVAVWFMMAVPMAAGIISAVCSF